jgi:DNA-binding CsgD family transcriptional regulator
MSISRRVSGRALYALTRSADGANALVSEENACAPDGSLYFGNPNRSIPVPGRTMALRLSSADIAALEHANTVLLAPFAYGNGESWRIAAGRAVETCLGGDASAFVLPGGDPYFAATPDVLRALQAILPPPDWIIRGLTVRRRQLGLDVIGWDDAFDSDAVKRTSFYNDIARPQGLLAPLMMVTDTAADVVPATISVYFTDERSAQRHAHRGKQLLQLLFPAFSAGLKNYVGLRRHCAALTALAEDAAFGVLFFDSRGYPGRENDSFQRLMAGDPERDRVRAEAAHMVRKILGITALSTGRMQRRANSEVRTRVARYRILVTFLELQSSADSGKAIALVERLEEKHIDAGELSARFSLTQREIEASQLLRKGLSSRQIASQLGISVNTARRHIESVLLKLDVHSRAAAAAKLSGN